MNDPTPPDEASTSSPDPAPSLRAAAALLVLLAIGEVLFGLFQAPLLIVGAAADPGWLPIVAAGRGALLTGIVVLLCVGLAVLDVVAAVGLLNRRPWGWALAVVTTLLRIPSACSPAAIAVLWLIGRAEVRSAVVGPTAPGPRDVGAARADGASRADGIPG